MLQEKTMVSDALNSINSGLKTYTDMISQTENQELRSALQQIRNETEKSQYELYTLAKNLRYYQPAQKANQEEVNNVKATFSGSSGMSGGSNTSGSSGTSGGSNNSGSSGMSGSTSKSGNSGTSSDTVTDVSDISGGSNAAGNSGSSNNKGGLGFLKNSKK